MRDYRKSLPQLRQEWENCTRCNLAERRLGNGFPLVFGEGVTGGIMFIGEGPGKNEEQSGQPFVGKSGQILRDTIRLLNLRDAYITNTVACRSCAPAYTSEGQPIMRTNYRTRLEEHFVGDEAPTQIQQAACEARLHEQIYLVDPVLIVALGAAAVKALTGKATPITSIRGCVQEIEIEGSWHVPTLTAKKKVWERKIQGQLSLPVELNRVRYLLLPTLHPAYVLRKLPDRSPGSPVECFAKDMKHAAAVYDRYMQEAFGILPGERDLTEDDIRGIEIT